MIAYLCNHCQEVNQISLLDTTETGEWVIECTCMHREVIDYDSFGPYTFMEMERIIVDRKLTKGYNILSGIHEEDE